MNGFQLHLKRPSNSCFDVGLLTQEANMNIQLVFKHYKAVTYRSSRPEVFCKKGVLKDFVKLTEKHLCQSLFFNKVAALRPATLLRKTLWHR